MSIFGEINWNDDVFADENGKKQTNNKDIWLRLEEGVNEIRIITQPFQYLVHKYKKEGDSGFGQKVGCSAIHGSCQLCDLAASTKDATLKAKPRWLLGVISRKSGMYKILDVGWSVFNGIRKLAKNTSRFGDPTKYDINIEVDKNGGATGYYTVQGYGREPLSADDQKIRDTQVDLDDLKRRVSPPTLEMVQKRLDKINGVNTNNNTVSNAGKNTKANTKTTTPPATVATPTVSMTDDEELEDSFPDYNATK